MHMGYRNVTKRALATVLLTAVLTMGAVGQDAGKRPAKPVDSDAILKSLVTLRQKARAAGLELTEEALSEAIAKIAKVNERQIVPCTTDLDCERKNPGR